MTTHVVPGIRRTSLSAQLAGLGVVRILAEQADPALRCHFTGSTLVIDTTVDDLATWLVDQYVPMPVLSPWNEGSGFGLKDRAPRVALEALLGLALPRLDQLRAAHAVVEPLATRSRAEGWPKSAVVTAVRNRCPDSMLPWLDAAVIALDADKLAFPPILGSGGNDGRLEFSTNFHQRLLELLPTNDVRRRRSLRLARDWLAGTGEEPLTKGAIGQFDPGAAGTPNSAPFGAAESVVNPWTFVLMIEGIPLFASAPARRLDSQARTVPRAAMTFMTRGSEFGSATGSADEESRGEVWVPWWDKPASFPAIKQLFSEGRAVWRGATAVDSGQMYLAVASRGVSPGVKGFDRYTIVKRNGLAFSAVLADEIETRDDGAVLIVADVEDWPDMVGRRSDPSASVTGALRRFSAARVRVARSRSRETQIGSIRELLSAVTDVELAVARSGRTREDVLPRSRPRPATNLVTLLRDGTGGALAHNPEFRVALSLASIVTEPMEDAPYGRTIREIVLPIDPPQAFGQRFSWRASAIVPGLGRRPLVDVLADLSKWMVTSARFRSTDGATSTCGVSAPSKGIRAWWPDLHAWVHGSLDEALLAAWFHALLALDWRDVTYTVPPAAPGPIDPTLALITAFRTGLPAERAEQGARYALSPEWISQLVAGHTRRVHESARRRLRQLGRTAAAPAEQSHELSVLHGKHLAAALLPVVDPTEPLYSVSRLLHTPTDGITDRDEDDKEAEEIA